MEKSFLLLETLKSSVHLHLCVILCVLFRYILTLDGILNIYVFNNIRNTQICIGIIDIVTNTTTTATIYLF